MSEHQVNELGQLLDREVVSNKFQEAYQVAVYEQTSEHNQFEKMISVVMVT